MGMPRVIATYLPQFHRVKENDKWWGEGFTEWTAVKAAKALYQGHEQPRKPLNGNYYNLLEKNVMQWQADLLHKYLLDGLCFWHYWFENGKKILEKPAENLLHWKDVYMPFCFCWANETWARTWSNIPRPNCWTSEYEPKRNKGDDGVLLKQNYGDEKEWKKHFLYLLPFFRDERYIKINGRPLFLIFRPFLIDCIKPMMKCWSRLAKEYEVGEIYLMGFNMEDTNSPYNSNIIESFGCYDSAVAARKYINGGSIQYIKYDDIWQTLLDTPFLNNEDCMCCTVRYDTTPRFGVNGTIIHGDTPEKFGNYLKKAIKKSYDNGSPFIFLNAWNEWAEGNYLEPDEKYKYSFLETIKKVKEEDYSYCTQVVHNNDNNKLLIDLRRKMLRFKTGYFLLNEWMNLKLSNKDISEFFKRNNYKKIAIYGWGEIGRILYKELENTEICVDYIIDRKGNFLSCEIPVYGINIESYPSVDVVVVTIPEQFNQIYDLLSEKCVKRIISIGAVINNM